MSGHHDELCCLMKLEHCVVVLIPVVY